MAKKESTVIYDKHVEICAEFLTDEQFGKLMFTLTMGKEPDFGDDQMLALAYAFIALQKNIDDKKYEKICETNRKNGRLGGAPKGNKNAKKQPKQPNAKINNPNEKENEKDKDNDDDTGLSDDSPDHDVFSLFGSFGNVRLTETENAALKQHYERTNELIDKVSLWLRSAKNDVPDHYGLCVKFANNDKWPKRKIIEPSEPVIVQDPLSEEEQLAKVADMRARLNGAIKSV